MITVFANKDISSPFRKDIYDWKLKLIVMVSLGITWEDLSIFRVEMIDIIFIVPLGKENKMWWHIYVAIPSV